MHPVKHYSLEVSHCYMFRHRFAIFGELENKGNFMLLNIMCFRISVIPVRAMQYRIQRAGLVLLGSG